MVFVLGFSKTLFLLFYMAIYHFSAKVFSRKSGASAVGKAAYRSGEDLYDRTIDETFNYAHRKNDISYKEIMTPDNVPKWAMDRQELWTKVEEIEKRKDSQLAREFVVALPCELSLDKNISIIKKYVADNFVSKGMIADIAIHDAESHNPHAHVMLTMREITKEGFGKKNRQWNEKGNLILWRKEWEEIVNDSLEENGINEKVDHRTLEAQGLDREPTIHVGVHASNMEDKGIRTRLGNFNRNVILRNRAIMLLKKSMGKVVKSPMQIWKLVKNSNQIKNLHPYLKPAASIPISPSTNVTFIEKLFTPPSQDNTPSIDI
jgi:ATP-dependent exoDNAse (exonuclease V) alpha subunit